MLLNGIYGSRRMQINRYATTSFPDEITSTNTLKLFHFNALHFPRQLPFPKSDNEKYKSKKRKIRHSAPSSVATTNVGGIVHLSRSVWWFSFFRFFLDLFRFFSPRSIE